MNLDDYSKAITRINDELETISSASANMAWAQAANTGNPIFVILLNRHARLTQLSSELTARMTAALGGG